MTFPRRVLVTGASGFLGRALVPRLAGRSSVTAVGRSQVSPFGAGVEWLTLDLCDTLASTRALHPWRWDAVVHLAGPVVRTAMGFDGERDVLSSHVRLALTIASVVPRAFTGRVLQASSMMVYGNPDTLPVSEHAPRLPTTMYGIGKMLAEDVLSSAQLRDLWMLRLPGLFAEHRTDGALYHFVMNARAGRPIRITAREPVRWEVLHLDDAAEAFVRALRASYQGAGALNVGYGQPVELESIARQIGEMAAVPVLNETGVHHPQFHLDIDRCREMLGDWPPVPLERRVQQLWTASGEGA